MVLSMCLNYCKSDSTSVIIFTIFMAHVTKGLEGSEKTSDSDSNSLVAAYHKDTYVLMYVTTLQLLLSLPLSLQCPL